MELYTRFYSDSALNNQDASVDCQILFYKITQQIEEKNVYGKIEQI